MKRFALPDLLKGFAVFLIVPVHILETFIDYPGRESLLGDILLVLSGPIAVPIFMIVMGYFVARSNKSTSRNLVRGIAIFILGLFLNIGLNFHLLLKIKYSGWQIQPLEYILGVDILYLAGISILILTMIKTLPKGQNLLLGILILTVSILTAYMNKQLMVTDRNYLLPFIAGNYSWSYFPIFPWIVYPLIGFLFQKEEARIKNFMQKRKSLLALVISIVALLVVVFGKFGIQTTIDLSAYYHHTFLYFLWAIGVVFLWIVLWNYIQQKIPNAKVLRCFRWLGKNITVFYVVQWLLIGNIATAIYQTQSLQTYGFWVVGIFTITLIVTLIFEVIRTKKEA